MNLFLDTETTGLPVNFDAPATDVRNWPRMVQAAWLKIGGGQAPTLQIPAGTELAAADYIVRPDGFAIPADATAIHGITTQYAVQNGQDIEFVLDRLTEAAAGATVLVAHNVAFDDKIVGAEMVRSGRPELPAALRRQCTMKSATIHCGLRGKYGYRWPTLQDLYLKLFNERLTSAHRAMSDVRACARCYFELKRLKVI